MLGAIRLVIEPTELVAQVAVVDRHTDLLTLGVCPFGGVALARLDGQARAFASGTAWRIGVVSMVGASRPVGSDGFLFAVRGFLGGGRRRGGGASPPLFPCSLDPFLQ